MQAEQPRPDRTVSRRKVFYIPGYDPIHPRRYRELYRKEGVEQARISDYDIALTPRQGGSRYGWQVDALIDGARVHADVDVLVWSDIVRGSMDASIVATYLQLARTAWIYIATGALFRLMRLRKGPVIAALYPVGMLLVQLAVAVGLGVFVWRLAGFGAVLGAPHVLTAMVGAMAAMAMAVLMLRWFKARDGTFYAYYLMHDYAFSARWGGANPPALEARMTEFGQAIEQALKSDVDEVLVVGHSSGAHLAVSVLADLIRAGRVPDQTEGQAGERAPALSFLSLGQVVPMMSFLPRADRLRGDLAFLSATDALAWVDITAPGDGCAFALCDPVGVSGVAPPDQRWPIVFSAAFTQTLSPDLWRSLRWRFFRLHFQYLCAFDRPRDYDYFRVTAGPRTLGDRYEGRPSSKSAIRRATSGYTSVTGQ